MVVAGFASEGEEKNLVSWLEFSFELANQYIM
jgi:hypothetical protein